MEKIRSMCWAVTNKCNENCKFCFRKLCNDNSLEQNKKIADNILQIGIDKITFSGGEPLLYESLFELAKYIKEKSPNTKLSITTNGILLNDDNLKLIYEMFDNISLSIDSADRDKLENIGRGYNHLDNCIKVLNKINGKIDIKINTVANKTNIDELDKIFDLIKYYNISRWKIFNFYPLRIGRENQELFLLSNEEQLKVKNIVDEIQKDTDISVYYNSTSDFATSYFNIYPDGSVENSKDEDIGNLIKDSVFDILKLKKEDVLLYNLANQVVLSRPKARWRYDQVFMNNESMVYQAQMFYKYLSDKNVVFLGDGDGASIHYGLLLKNELVGSIKQITVLDFDERILNYHKKLYDNNNLSDLYELNLVKYNVINPIPAELKEKFDFFYINPPYGAFNNGKSIIAWLHRCLDLCSQNSMGCIVIPYDINFQWSIDNMKYIEEFLKCKNFEIVDKKINIHDYDFGGTSNLKSSTYIVKKIADSYSEYTNMYLPKDFTENLYRKPRDIPKYIIDDNTEYGVEEF